MFTVFLCHIAAQDALHHRPIAATCTGKVAEPPVRGWPAPVGALHQSSACKYPTLTRSCTSQHGADAAQNSNGFPASGKIRLGQYTREIRNEVRKFGACRRAHSDREICYGQLQRDRYFRFHALIGVRLCVRGQFDQICSQSVSSLRAA